MAGALTDRRVHRRTSVTMAAGALLLTTILALAAIAIWALTSTVGILRDAQSMVSALAASEELAASQDRWSEALNGLTEASSSRPKLDALENMMNADRPRAFAKIHKAIASLESSRDARVVRLGRDLGKRVQSIEALHSGDNQFVKELSDPEEVGVARAALIRRGSDAKARIQLLSQDIQQDAMATAERARVSERQVRHLVVALVLVLSVSFLGLAILLKRMRSEAADPSSAPVRHERRR